MLAMYRGTNQRRSWGRKKRISLGGNVVAWLSLVARSITDCLLFCLPDDDVGRLPSRSLRGAIHRNLLPDYVHSHMSRPALGRHHCYTSATRMLWTACAHMEAC